MQLYRTSIDHEVSFGKHYGSMLIGYKPKRRKLSGLFLYGEDRGRAARPLYWNGNVLTLPSNIRVLSSSFVRGLCQPEIDSVSSYGEFRSKYVVNIQAEEVIKSIFTSTLQILIK
jgi:hypothetical protein